MTFLTQRKLVVGVLVSLIAFHAPVAACLWDRDTLEQERQRFPSVLELIAGQFLRHSDAFYEWRIEDRTRRMEQETDDPRLYDDLAVAYEKLGDHDRAIEIMLQKEARFPGLYETFANLGTFQIHAGNYDEGLLHIRRAIEINPDAHFGREIYQQRLVEYLLTQRDGGELTLPLDPKRRSPFQRSGFVRFLLENEDTEDPEEKDKDAWRTEIELALTGVSGMMRFGNHDSPVLLEALGDLLLARGYPEDGKRLASRAYLKASYETKGATSKAYRAFAENALSGQTTHSLSTAPISIDAIERELKKELESADLWFRELKTKEARWIAEGADPEAKFSNEYSEQPIYTQADQRVGTLRNTIVLATCVLGVVAMWVGSRVYYRRRKSASADRSA